MSFTDFWKTKAIFIITSPEGIYLHDSIALMVCRLTPTLSASSCCEILNTALSTLMLFLISGRFFQLIHSVIEYTDEQNEKNVNIVERKPKVSKAIEQQSHQYQQQRADQHRTDKGTLPYLCNVFVLNFVSREWNENQSDKEDNREYGCQKTRPCFAEPRIGVASLFARKGSITIQWNGLIIKV